MGKFRRFRNRRCNCSCPQKQRQTELRSSSFRVVVTSRYQWRWKARTLPRNFQDHGLAAFVVKYRLPSDRSMEDKSPGPLEDAQQAMRMVRGHAAEWKIDPHKIGVMGFSAGGHLASTLGTHFEKAYMRIPTEEQVRLFSNETQVTDKMRRR